MLATKEAFCCLDEVVDEEGNMSEQTPVTSFLQDPVLLKAPTEDKNDSPKQEEVECYQKSQELMEDGLVEMTSQESCTFWNTPGSRDKEESDEIKIVSFTSQGGAQEGQSRKSNRRSLFFGRKDSGPDYGEHMGKSRRYWRDIMLGVNDGLVSTFLLVAGVTGANLSNEDILLTAISGTIAGAISMAAGEYLATKTQQEVMDGESKLERKHMQTRRAAELEELVENFAKIGIPENDNSEEVVSLRSQLLSYYDKHDEAHLKAHIILELGEMDEVKRNPFVAGGVSFLLFFAGALPTVIPFAVTHNTKTGFIAAAIATTLGLFLVGVIKTWATRGSLIIAAIENLLIASCGGAIAYGVGVGFEKLLN